MTETRAEYICNPAENPERGIWQGYSLATGTGEARRLFAAKFGYEPREVKSGGACILAGPVREEANDA